MSTKQFAAQMKAAIEDAKSNGTAAIYCDYLITYLNNVQSSPEQEPTPLEIEQYKANLQHAIETNKLQHESNLEMFRSVITAGQSAIKSSFLMNGGASVALLAFISHLAQFNVPKVATFAGCLIPFVIGVLVITVTAGLTYLSQWFYGGNWSKCQTVGFVINIITILLGLSSYGLFIWGIYCSYRAFTSYA